jgi:prefoldin subunit 5
MQPNTELSATSILSLFQTTKAERQSFVAEIINKVKDGGYDPREFHYQLKCMEQIIEMIKENEDYKKVLISVSEKWGRSFQYENSKFEVKEVGVKYDFSVCNDPVMNDLIKQKEELAKSIKEREAMLKAIPESGMELLQDDEVITIYRANKTSSTAVAVTLK